MVHVRRKTKFRVLASEWLESRCVLSALAGLAAGGVLDAANDFHAAIVAGDPNGTPADSPADRVDVNSATSPFAGVGSLRINAKRGTYICTATPIDTTHVLTAAHCVDINNDGLVNTKDGLKSIVFQLNTDVDAPSDKVDTSISAVGWVLHPDYTGFNRPSVNDDLAIVTLGVPVSSSLVYSLPTDDMAAGVTRLDLVGYGQSGTGTGGYTVGASYTVKRHGENMVDAFYAQDDAGKPAGNEVFRFDFDGATGNGSMGGGTLGNDRETTIGGGDSGGPSFALIDAENPNLASSYQLIGVNTFTQGFNAPKFGSLGGGINVYPYLAWINGVLTGAIVAQNGGTGGGGHGASSNSDSTIGAVVYFAWQSEFVEPVGLHEADVESSVEPTSRPQVGSALATQIILADVVTVPESNLDYHLVDDQSTSIVLTDRETVFAELDTGFERFYGMD